MAIEGDLRRRVVALFREQGYFVQAIDTTTNPGMPDLYYRKGEAGWLELKHVKTMPVRAYTSVFTSYNHPLSYEQINWIISERKHGGKANILVGYQRDYFLIPGKLASEFNEFTEPDLRRFAVNKTMILTTLKGEQYD